MLLDLDDLPAGWTVMDNRRWRTGQTQAPWSQRAKRLGGVTGWRSFQSSTKDEWVWAEAIPLASDSDVTEALAEIWSRTLKNLRANVRLVDECDGPVLTGLGASVRTLEQSTDGLTAPVLFDLSHGVIAES